MSKEKDYSNRELDRMFGEIKSLLIEIKEQTTKTNGRVNTLEHWKESLMGKIIGAGSVVGFVWSVVWFYITKKI